MSYFQFRGGAVRLVEKIDDPRARHMEWGCVEQDEYTIPFGWTDDPDALSNQPWVWRYGQANNGTGAAFRILATRVHADVASRLGGPIVVTVLSPWQAAYAFADEGYLDPQYVAEKLVPRGLLHHPDDLETLTTLTRLVLGRGAS